MAKTVADVFARGGEITALAADRAGDYLAQALPVAAAGERAASGGVERFSIERGVAIVPVRGLLTPNSQMLERYLGWATYRGIEETCEALAADDGVAAAVFEIDSPGGYVIGCAGAGAAIKALAAVKPVYVLAAPLAASAAYWLASCGTEISMTIGAEVGSIGCARAAVRSVQPSSSGDQYFDFVSPNARAKIPDPTTDEGVAEIMRSLGESEAAFHAAVSEGRGIALAALPAALSVTDDPVDGGALFGGAQAVARGLADRIETRAEFYARVFAAHGLAARSGGRAAKALAAAAMAVSRG